VEEAYLVLARDAQARNDLQEAFTHYQKVLTHNPHNADALFWLGCECYRQNNITQAIAHFQQRLTVSPCAKTEFYLGIAHSAQHNYVDALTHLTNATHLDPTHEIYHLYHGSVLERLHKTDEALRAFQRATELNNGLDDAHLHAAHILQQQHRLPEALQQIHAALEAKPKDQRLRQEYAHLLAQAHQTEAACTLYAELLEEDPTQIELLGHLADAFRYTGNYDQANQGYSKLLTLQPTNQHALDGLAAIELHRGNLTKGFEYTARANDARKKLTKQLISTFQIPRKTILIRTDGLDAVSVVHLLRYAPLIHAAGGIVLMEIERSLMPIAQACAAITSVMADDEQLPSFDFQVQLSSLPYLFKTTPATIPTTPYLYAAEEKSDYWQAKLAFDQRYKVGLFFNKPGAQDFTALVRACSPAHSVGLYALAQLPNDAMATLPATACVTFVGGTAQHGAMDERIAFMRHMDLVVTDDTVTAQLAGALHVPVRFVVPDHVEYYWLSPGQSSWYPTLLTGSIESIIAELSAR